MNYNRSILKEDPSLPRSTVADAVTALYDRQSALYAQQYVAPSKTVDDFLAFLPERATILEVGCGPGVDANYFAHKGLKVVATDIAPEMVRIAQDRFPSVDFRVQDMRHLDFPDGFFDGLYAESSFIHIPKKDALRTLQGFRRILKVGGVLALGLQEGEPAELLRPAPFAADELVFLNIMSHDESCRLLKDAGFTVVKDYSLAPKRQGQHPFIKRKLFARKVAQTSA